MSVNTRKQLSVQARSEESMAEGSGYAASERNLGVSPMEILLEIAKWPQVIASTEGTSASGETISMTKSQVKGSGKAGL